MFCDSQLAQEDDVHDGIGSSKDCLLSSSISQLPEFTMSLNQRSSGQIGNHVQPGVEINIRLTVPGTDGESCMISNDNLECHQTVDNQPSSNSHTAEHSQQAAQNNGREPPCQRAQFRQGGREAPFHFSRTMPAGSSGSDWIPNGYVKIHQEGRIYRALYPSA